MVILHLINTVGPTGLVLAWLDNIHHCSSILVQNLTWIEDLAFLLLQLSEISNEIMNILVVQTTHYIVINLVCVFVSPLLEYEKTKQDISLVCNPNITLTSGAYSQH